MMAKIDMAAELTVDGDNADEIRARALEKIDEFLGGAEARKELEDSGAVIESGVWVRPKEFPLGGYVGEITIEIRYGHYHAYG